MMASFFAFAFCAAFFNLYLLDPVTWLWLQFMKPLCLMAYQSIAAIGDKQHKADMTNSD